MDHWLADRYGTLLRTAADPLVVDLGYGGAPVTTVELYRRLRRVRRDVRVVGLEIEPSRVEQGRAVADPPGLSFARGGFELAGLRPVLVRAANVLRQYPEEAVAGAWTLMSARGAVVVDATCDELGRLGAWVAVEGGVPVTLTLAARPSTLERPAAFAERLPKALIHRNVPGERVHALLTALDDAWRDAAGATVFGARDRWRRTVEAVHGAGVPVCEPPARWRDGVITVPWTVVAPGVA
ncbi:class I SAM-dependent methyltransferase [Phytomonospora sp. NPDC050363]|uniref:class I SAM-dependent methyltransferase n=1 Tax=Phytomonospora sp. NPDC050363 TaxID=3155642 RepID=UPI0033F84747